MELAMLLERESELGALDAVIERASNGAGGLVAIEAPAGLGKTRLLRAARDSGPEAGLQVLTARATALERDFPFSVVRQLFEPLLAIRSDAERDALFAGAEAARHAFDISLNGGGRAASAGDSFSVLHGLYWMTAALSDCGPLMLAIDDAHWADASSLDYLGFLLPRLEELPVAVILTCRPDEADAALRLRPTIDDPDVRHVTPRALSAEAAATLLGAELERNLDPDFAATCHEVTGGNPFLLRELARTLSARGIDPDAHNAGLVRELAPERVTQSVLSRVERLSPPARAVARALAVLGDDSSPQLVAELAGLGGDALRDGADALRRGAIMDASASLRFVHPLIRNAVYSDLPAGERAVLHAQAARLLGASGASAEQVAAHLVAGEPRGERDTVEALLAAGRAALADGAPRSTIAYLMRALREPAPDDLRADVLGPLLTASARTADPTVYLAIEADVLAAIDRDPALKLAWVSDLMAWMVVQGRGEQAASMLSDAIEAAVAAGDVDHAYRLEAELAILAQQPAAEVRAQFAHYRGRIDPDSASGRLEAALDAYWCALDGTASDAADLARRAVDGGKIFTEQTGLAAAGGAVHVLLLANDLDTARNAAEQALTIAQQRDATTELIRAWHLRGNVRWALGDLAAAEADLRQSVSIAQLAGLHITLPVLLPTLIDVLVERGELDVAEAELAAIGMATIDVPDMVWLQALLFERGRLRMEQGRTHEALDDLLELERRRERMGLSSAPIMQTGPYVARVLTELGERERALEVAARAVADSRRWGAPGAIARALRAQGLAVGGAAGLDLLAEAVATLDGSQARLLRAHALADFGSALRRANRRADARAPLREALDIARRCGAARLAKRAHDELQATGEKVRRYTPIGIDSLTPSERRVAELAATGMTNREIARTLFLTVKTIESHLSAAYDKLGIHSRGELPGSFSA